MAYNEYVLAAVCVNYPDNIYYTIADHLGSVLKLVDGNGTEVFAATYDAWGNRTITNNTYPYQYGYTGHEHLYEFSLINMNSRLYDPAVGRFLSPDPYVQMPDNSQNLNRYSYCLNNPLKYTDPSGEFIFSALLPGIGTFIDAACWGAVIGGLSYTANVAFSDGGFSNWSWGGFGKALGFGAASGVMTAGIGESLGAVGYNGIAGEIKRAVAHGVSNGIMSGLQGGDPLTGFITGGVSSLASSAFMMYGGPIANDVVGNLAFSGLVGGATSAMAGGNFWEGATTGVMVAGLNHVRQGLNKLIYNKIWNKVAPFPVSTDGLRIGGGVFKMGLKIWKNANGLLTLHTEASHYLSEDAEVSTSAWAELYKDGKQLSNTQGFTMPRDNLRDNTAVLQPLGDTYFYMPKSGAVSVSFHGGWNVNINNSNWPISSASINKLIYIPRY